MVFCHLNYMHAVELAQSDKNTPAHTRNLSMCTTHTQTHVCAHALTHAVIFGCTVRSMTLLLFLLSQFFFLFILSPEHHLKSYNFFQFNNQQSMKALYSTSWSVSLSGSYL